MCSLKVLSNIESHVLLLGVLAPHSTIQGWLLIQTSVVTGIEKAECAAEFSHFGSGISESRLSGHLPVPQLALDRKVKLSAAQHCFCSS